MRYDANHKATTHRRIVRNASRQLRAKGLIGLSAGQLGATYVIPTVIVPLLLITHGLAFRILLQHRQVLR